MSTIVPSGSIFPISSFPSLSVDGTIAAGGKLDGAGTMIGQHTLYNLGTIASDSIGGTLAIATGALNNSGTMIASSGVLNIGSAVAVSNYSTVTGALTGGVWEATGSGTVAFNPGSIQTDNATIVLSGTAASFEVYDPNVPGLVPIQSDLATVGATGALDLIGGQSFQAANTLLVSGTVALTNATVSAVSGLTIAAGGKVVGSGTLDPSIPVTDSGTIEASGGTLTAGANSQVSGSGVLKVDAGASMALENLSGAYGQSIQNSGIIDAAYSGYGFTPGTLVVGGGGNPAYSGTGSFLIQGGPDTADEETLDLEGTATANVDFDTNFGELYLGNPSAFTGSISHFGNSETIQLSGISHATHAVLSGSTLEIENASNSILQKLTLNTGSINYLGSPHATFTVTENAGQNLATVTVANAQAAACYAAGTRIRTARGDVAVECLKAGDIVVAHFAGETPVVWMGHRFVDCRRHPDPAKVRPVLVETHAFGPREPYRDLLLSPDHAVFVDGVLIPIRALINGRTIRQLRHDTVVYYHVELGEHDVLLAEGLPAESYLENGDRAAFDNGGGAVLLHPEFGARRWEALGCAQMVVTGKALDSVRSRLLARVPKRRRGAQAA